MEKIISAWEVIKFNVLLRTGRLVRMGKPLGFEEGKEEARRDFLDMIICLEAFGDFEEADRIREMLKTY